MNPMQDDIRELVALAKNGGGPELAGRLAEKENEAPYASLVYILQAMGKEQEDATFKAAIYAPERGRLRDLMIPSGGESMITKVEDVPTPALVAEPPEKEPMNEAKAVEAPVEKTELAPLAEPTPEIRHVTPPPVMKRSIPVWHIAPLSIAEPTAGMVESGKESWELSIHRAGHSDTMHTSLNDFVTEQTNIYQPAVSKVAAEMKPARREEELVSRFLATPPAQIRKPVPVPQPLASGHVEQQASQSLANDQNMVTETLAQLHLRQNHPDEAVRIYEQLCLRYPEKKSYFTAQIEKIKDQKL